MDSRHTHDTMAMYGGAYAKCQEMSLREQLDAGIRALDIRVRYKGCGATNLKIYHGIMYQYTNWEEVVSTLETWISSHPTEFVLVFSQNEMGDNNACENKELYDYMKEFTDFENTWVDIESDKSKWVDTNPNQGLVQHPFLGTPTSRRISQPVHTKGDLSGKLVFMRKSTDLQSDMCDHPDSPHPQGETCIREQNRFQDISVESKWHDVWVHARGLALPRRVRRPAGVIGGILDDWLYWVARNALPEHSGLLSTNWLSANGFPASDSTINYLNVPGAFGTPAMFAVAINEQAYLMLGGPESHAWRPGSKMHLAPLPASISRRLLHPTPPCAYSHFHGLPRPGVAMTAET